MKCTNIQEVIQRLDIIIQHSIATNNSQGFFAIVYYKVTCSVAEGITKNKFENSQLMETLDVIFANRYLEAYDNYTTGKPCSLSWKIAFEACDSNKPIALQHILAGINAHINLDLGIAAKEAIGDTTLDSIKPNFFQINQVLRDMIDIVKIDLCRMSIGFRLLIPFAKRLDEKMVQFSIETARDGAWAFAQELNTVSDAEKRITIRDVIIAQLGQKIIFPGRTLSFILSCIKRLEFKTTGRQIELLKGEI